MKKKCENYNEITYYDTALVNQPNKWNYLNKGDIYLPNPDSNVRSTSIYS